MRLDGRYDNPYTRSPKSIRATGTPDEFGRIVGPIPSDFPVGYLDGDSEHWHAQLPPDRDVVQRIAKAVEVECDDQRLIDWMASE